MANFISKRAPKNWYPSPHEWVKGKSGKKEYVGKVIPSIKNERKPAVFRKGRGVFCYILTPAGKRVAVHELEPLT